MPKLTVVSDNTFREIPFSPGFSIRDILDAAGIRIRSGCRGNGACGLCLVRVEAGTANDPTKNELLLVTGEQIGQNIRLACQVTPADDLSVRIIGRAAHDDSAAQGLRYDKPQLFEAFIKATQYIVRLKTQQDVWDHLGKFILAYFPATWTAFVQRDAEGGLSIHHCTLPGEAAERVLTDETRVVIADVLDSGFLASRAIQTPAPSMTAFLPIMEGRMKRVMLIGHAASDPMPHELLNIYLAVAGLAGATFERLQNEHELTMHRARLEELVQERTAELEAANRELEAFSYSVSHDLRSPLRSIDGFSRTLMEDYEDKLDETGKDYLRRVRAAAKKMAQLIDAMLDLSRMSRGALNRAETNLSLLARDVADGLKTAEHGRIVEFAAADGVTADVDPVMVRAVFENLIGNAWKFTAKREAARVEFGVMRKDGKDVYFVRDNGAGFDPACANKLFTPFQRLHGNSEFPGIGIGLATVQRIIHRHGGSIWAEGEVGKGATFYFTL
jgi:signal transduction histidine kinase/ferredoxin